MTPTEWAHLVVWTILVLAAIIAGTAIATHLIDAIGSRKNGKNV